MIYINYTLGSMAPEIYFLVFISNSVPTGILVPFPTVQNPAVGFGFAPNSIRIGFACPTFKS